MEFDTLTSPSDGRVLCDDDDDAGDGLEGLLKYRGFRLTRLLPSM